MASSDYYWTRHLIQGFGKMWFLIVPQEADSPGGGENLLGSVVNEIEGRLFPPNGGIIGKDYPEPYPITTPQLILKEIKLHRQELGIVADDPIVQEVKYVGLSLKIDKKRLLKVDVGGFPSLPATLSIDYSRMSSITISFGENTRRKFIPTGYLSSLKNFVGGDDRKIAANVNIDKETIIHQILLTNEYQVTFESISVFDSNFEAAIQQANQLNSGKLELEIDSITRQQVSVAVRGDRDYLIALKDIDWDDF